MSCNAHHDPRSAPKRTQHTHAAGEQSVVCAPSPYGTAGPLIEWAVPIWCPCFATSSFHGAQLPSSHLAGKMWAWKSIILTQPSGKIQRLYSQSTSKQKKMISTEEPTVIRWQDLRRKPTPTPQNLHGQHRVCTGSDPRRAVASGRKGFSKPPQHDHIVRGLFILPVFKVLKTSQVCFVLLWQYVA